MRKINNGRSGIRERNRQRVMRAFLDSDGSLTKQELVRQLQLSLPTVTQILNELMEEELIREGESCAYTGGRNAQGYVVADDARITLGFYITMNAIFGVAVGLKGDVRSSGTYEKTYRDDPAYYAEVRKLVSQFMEENGIEETSVRGIGFSIQGIVDSKENKVLYAPIMGTTDVDLTRLTEGYRYPVRVFHDCDAAAYAELRLNSGLKNVFFLGLGEYLGGAYIANGVIEEEGFGRGRVEHLTIVPGGRQCYCGQKGCAETYCSSRALLKDSGCSSPDEFFDRIGEKEIAGRFAEYLGYLSLTLNNIHIMFGCDVILGGSFVRYLTPYMEQLKELVYQRDSFGHCEDYLLVGMTSAHSAESGAALRMMDDYINGI